MRQVLVDFGVLNLFGSSVALRVYGYGLMLVLGFLLGVALAQRRARRCGENPEVIARCGVLALVGGIVGARAAFVIEKWDTQFAGAGLGEIVNVTSGGLIYHGGLVLAAFMVLAYLLVRRLPVRRHLDIVAASVMLGLAFGRAGCLLNGCCFGGACDEHWALGMRFPMFSPPLVKFGGDGGPFASGTEGPSPVYAHQYGAMLVRPDERLVNNYAATAVARNGRVEAIGAIHAPRYLHGRLENDQLRVMFGTERQAMEKFAALAGGDGRASGQEWRRGLKDRDGFLRGSETWDEALCFDANRDGQLSFDEAWSYLQARRRSILARFAGDGRGELTERQRDAAQAYLQADLFAQAESERSSPVKPAQALDMVNALLLAAILTGFHRLRSREGQVFALMLMLYPVTRFILEAIRDDNPHNLRQGVLTHNQYTAMAVLAVGVIMMTALQKLPPSAGPTWSERLASLRAGPGRRAGAEGRRKART